MRCSSLPHSPQQSPVASRPRRRQRRRRGKTHQLKPTPKTVAWGYYDAAAKPVLKIASGDTVEVETLLTSSPQRLEQAFVPDDLVEKALRDIFKEVDDKGPGGHILTGPIFVEGAEPGDTLEVRVKDVKMLLPYAFTAFYPNSGLLPRGLPTVPHQDHLARHKADGPASSPIPLKCTAEAVLREHGGSPAAGTRAGQQRTAGRPRRELRQQGAGGRHYPLHPSSCQGQLLFAVGDGHAAQGDGEVCLTAIETSLAGTFQFVVRKDMKLKWPRAETPTHYIVMGVDKDLTEAMKLATREAAIVFLVTEKKLSKEDAYMLASVAVDFRVTQVVDGVKGVSTA